MSFQITPLPRAAFAPLFGLDDDALRARGARRMIPDAPQSAPCRVSLRDADPGEAVLLVNHTHLDADSPYRASHAVYVSETAAEARPEPGELPDSIARRILAVRAFDHNAMMLDADIAGGTELPDIMKRMFDRPETAFLHLHYAKRGCYAAKVVRAEEAAPFWL